MAAPYCDGAWLIAELLLPDGKEQPTQGLYNPKGQYKVVNVASETASVDLVKPDIGPASDFLLSKMAKEMDHKREVQAAAKQQEEKELLARLEDGDVQARCKAFSELAATAGRGWDRSIRALNAGLADTNASIRNAALAALPELVTPGDDRLELLTDSADVGIRSCALSALAIVSRKGDAGAVAKATAALQDPIADIRKAAFASACALAQPGDQAAVTALVACLADARGDVRTAAAATLPHLASKSDGFAAMAIASHLSDAKPEVRSVALNVLARVAPLPAARAAAAKLSDESRMVREAAAEAVVAGRGDEEVLGLVAETLGSARVEVRRTAAAVLPRVAERSRAAAMAEECVKSGNAGVRLTGVEVLAAQKGEGIATLGKCLEDSDEEVRTAAVKALAGAKGDKRASSEAQARLRHKFSDVRLAAVRALAGAAERGDEEAIAALSACQGESNLDVKSEVSAALEALVM
eukprot:CAMPEP_0171095592 /NCGR_PEP_ID=MMETSP0766_2-20121228/43256_1 /TAXON_ID=439317 /ORGANISM="Gambierdiscus australes, Strain CAWD 149" /LENGTH=468 /DNA_ID=CAMNT_0011554417 /DNA_START=60 /DNA_END=1466 /DNA_ORIENTATION=+